VTDDGPEMKVKYNYFFHTAELPVIIKAKRFSHPVQHEPSVSLITSLWCQSLSSWKCH